MADDLEPRRPEDWKGDYELAISYCRQLEAFIEKHGLAQQFWESVGEEQRRMAEHTFGRTN